MTTPACDPLCPFVACDDCEHQPRTAHTGQLTIFDALEDTE